MLLRAVPRIAERFPDLKVCIVGDGPLRAELEDQARDLGVSERVRFTGVTSDVQSWLATFDVFVLCSRREGQGKALMEAMASGVGVISTYHSGIPELIENGVSGLLAQEKNCDQIADHILTLARNPELAVTLTRNAREVIEEKFNSTKLNDQLEELCKRALTDSGVAPQSTE